MVDTTGLYTVDTELERWGENRYNYKKKPEDHKINKRDVYSKMYYKPVHITTYFRKKCLERDSNSGSSSECLLEFDTCSKPLSHHGWISTDLSCN